MIKDITIGQYFPGNTLIHRLDPRIKIIVSLAFIITLFFINNFIPYLFVLGFILLVIRTSEVPLKFILKGIRPLIFIIALTFVINMFFTGGEILVALGPLSITKEGLYQATFMALRLIFLVIGTSILTLTTSPFLTPNSLASSSFI